MMEMSRPVMVRVARAQATRKVGVAVCHVVFSLSQSILDCTRCQSMLNGIREMMFDLKLHSCGPDKSYSIDLVSESVMDRLTVKDDNRLIVAQERYLAPRPILRAGTYHMHVPENSSSPHDKQCNFDRSGVDKA